MRWTTRQNELIREKCYLGADAVCAALASELGVVRSRHCVEMQASRLHVSLRRLEVCPACGVVGARLNRGTGLCPLCTEYQHVEEERAFNALLEEERRGKEDGEELERLRREYDALRQRNSRICRKHGLAGKRERMRADPE